MADLSAGALTVSIDADLTKLEQGLNKAEQKVGEATQDLDKMSQSAEKAGEKTGGSFKGAAVQVEQFQAKLSKVLGVFAGLAAGLAILDGISKAMIAASRNTGALSDEFAKFDRDYVEFTKDIPLIGQLTGFIDRLGVAFGLLSDPIQEAKLEVYALEKAIENIDKLRTVRRTIADFQALAFEMESGASALEMFQMGFDPLQRQAEDALLTVEQQIRDIEKQLDQFRGADGGLFFDDTEEGRKQEQIYNDLLGTLEGLKIQQRDLETATNDVLQLRREELETIERQNQALAAQDVSDLKSTLQDIANLRFDETGLPNLRPFEELTKQITDQFEAQLQKARELASTLNAAEAQKLLADLDKVEEQFDAINVKQKVIDRLAAIQRKEFKGITEELAKQADAAELDLRIEQNKGTALGDRLKLEREVGRVQEEFAKKREELEKKFREGRNEGIGLAKISEDALADALAELDRTERARVAAVLAGEKEITKEKKKQLAISEQTFDTGFGESVFVRQLPVQMPDIDRARLTGTVQAPDVGPLQSPDVDLAALTGTVQTAEDSVANILQDIFIQDSDRNTLLRDIRSGINKLQTVGGGTSRAFT
tara:strand:+ start:11884 stop:13677 length:1794 start_codon:yes stop_codon:yes gene_type:complete